MYTSIQSSQAYTRSPQEEFDLKISLEDFEAAREIGLKYNINLDVIYQAQWSNSILNLESIHKFLYNVSDKNWVVNECLERVPIDFESMYALIDYGLKITDLKEIFVFNKEEEEVIVKNYKELSYVYLEKVQKILNDKREQFILNSFEDLKPNQRYFLVSRLKLLDYKEKLKIFEKICFEENQNLNDIKFDFVKYKQIRDKSYFEISIEYAHENNWKAIKVLFTYAGNHTLIHRLPILSNFPETISPLNYQAILPVCSPNKIEELGYKWNEIEIKQEDWIYKYCDGFLEEDLEDVFEKDFYLSNLELNEFKIKDLSRNLIEKWYDRRAREIEELSSLVNNSLTLLSIGIKNNVNNLEKLKQDMEIYHMLIYECIPRYNLGDVDFSEFEQYNIKRKIDVLMSGALNESENFVECFKLFLIPFLEKTYETGSKIYFLLMHQYIISISRIDLKLCYQLFKHCLQNDESDKSDFGPECIAVFENVNTMVNLMVDCIYSNNEADQLSIAYSLIDCLPKDLVLNKNSKSMLDSLKSHLIVVQYFSCYQYLVSASFVRNLQETQDKEELRKIYVSMCKFSLKNLISPICLNSLELILNDLHEIRRICFENILSIEEINYLFVKALLFSEKKEIIDLTRNFLTLDQSKSACMRSISYDYTIKIIHDCALEYVNSADSADDEVINLAINCLKLSLYKNKGYPYLIRKELDFIESLHILKNEFDLHLLPIQIRLFPDPKIDVVKAALKSFPKAYKKVNIILRLADLLYIYENRRKEFKVSKILSLIGEFAIKNSDYKECFSICKIMMNNDYKLGWEICKKLALITDYTDNDCKYDLLCFALANAPDDGNEICSIVNQINELKISTNENTTKKSFHNLIINKTQDVSDMILNKTQDVALVTSHLTKWLVQNIIKEDESLKIAKDYERIDKEIEMESKNKLMIDSINVPAFYLDAFEYYENFKIKKNDLDIDYSHYVFPNFANQALPFTVGQLYLRTSLMQSNAEDCLNDKDKINDLLQELAFFALFHDTPLALNYLHCLNDYDLVEKVLDNLSSKSPTLMYIALYFYSIEFCKKLNSDYDLSLVSIKDVILKAEAYRISGEKVFKLNELIGKYKKLYNDLIKADCLLSLYPEIDVNRFVSDEVYKKETLLGLAMTEDDQSLDNVLNLAIQYNVHFSEIYLSYVENLLTFSMMDSDKIDEKIFDNIDLMSALIERYEEVTKIFEERIYPLISGVDYPRLMLYFKILKKINDEDQSKKIVFVEHFKNLKKLRKIVEKPYLDYKKLIHGEKTFVELFYPVLNEANYNLVARWTITLNLGSKQGETQLNASAIYSIWLRKIFIKNKPKWKETYEENLEVIKKLNPKDYLYFFNFYILSPDAQNLISDINERFYYLESALEYVKKRQSKNKADEKNLWDYVYEELTKIDFYN